MQYGDKNTDEFMVIAHFYSLEIPECVIIIIIIIIQYSVWRQVQSLFQNDSST